MSKLVIAPLAALVLVACQQAGNDTDGYTDSESTATADRSELQLGNGEANAITTEGITRSGSVFTVPEVKIAQNGWLIMHPFRDGAPVGNEYVGATLLEAGTSNDVTIDIGEVPEPGDMFIIMLHNDVNDDGVFDFGDGDKHVPDEPTFEHEVLIAHPIATPVEADG